MTAVPFDTLKLKEGLEAGGFTGEQARATVTALVEVSTAADYVTKAEFHTGLHDLEQRLTIRLGGMFVVSVGVLLAAIRYLPLH